MFSRLYQHRRNPLNLTKFLVGDFPSVQQFLICSHRSGNSDASPKDLTHSFTLFLSNFGYLAAIVLMSSKSLGRWAMAFMIIRSSGVGRRTDKPAKDCVFALSTISSSKGRMPKETSISVSVGLCLSNRTRFF
jgi:hypothetical protein